MKKLASVAVATVATLSMVTALTPSCLLRELDTPAPQEGLVNCRQYSEMSCCTNATDSLIVPNEKGEQLYNFNWDQCGALSPECQAFFQAESCYFECDPYQAKFKNVVEKTPVTMVGVPLCASYCEAWFDACKNDLTCAAEWMVDLYASDDGTYFECGPNTVCKTFAEIFHNPIGLCDILWGNAFYYSEDEDNCVVWDWPLTQSNPNKDVKDEESHGDHCVHDPHENKFNTTWVAIEPGCLANREKSDPTPESDLGVCKKYNDLACCTSDVDEFVTSGKNRFNYEQGCGELSTECAKYFEYFACFEECDPYLVNWYDAIFLFPHRPVGVPLCADFCNNWFEACRFELTCGVNWVIDYLPIKSGGEVVGHKCNPANRCVTFNDIYKTGDGLCDALWGSYYHFSHDEENCFDLREDNLRPHSEIKKYQYGIGVCEVEHKEVNTAAIVLGVLFAVVTVSAVVIIAYLLYREKQQRPVLGTPMKPLE